MSERDPSPRPEHAPRPDRPPAPDDVVQALADFVDDLVEDGDGAGDGEPGGKSGTGADADTGEDDTGGAGAPE